MTRKLLQEPGWELERKGSQALLRRDPAHSKNGTARVRFRSDVEVREFERDEDYCATETETREAAASALAMCASCLAALCVTVLLPWLLIGG